MASDILAEALARVEFKLDLLLRHLKVNTNQMMQIGAHTCPVCSMVVTYQVDLAKSVVVRKCACGTGKIPPPAWMQALLNPIPGAPSADSASSPDASPEDGPQRKDR